MQIHQLKPSTKKQSKKRVGRGGKRGSYSGRGSKGQRGHGVRVRPYLRDIIKRIPKKRGYRFKSIQIRPAVVNIELLEKKFKEGDRVTPKTLLDAGLIGLYKGKIPEVKLLGSGSITKKLLVSECQISAPAKEKIEKAGGSISEQVNKGQVSK